MYLPANDRRTYVAASNCKKEEFEPEYWNKFWVWYEGGGFEHVAAYLATRDISNFDPKAPPPKTQAFWEIVDAGRPAEEGELMDVIESLIDQKAFTWEHLYESTVDHESLGYWFQDRKNRGKLSHRLAACDYKPVRNPDAKDGLWKVGGKRQVVYVKKELSIQDQLAAAEKLASGFNPGRRNVEEAAVRAAAEVEAVAARKA